MELKSTIPGGVNLEAQGKSISYWEAQSSILFAILLAGENMVCKFLVHNALRLKSHHYHHHHYAKTQPLKKRIIFCTHSNIHTSISAGRYPPQTASFSRPKVKRIAQDHTANRHEIGIPNGQTHRSLSWLLQNLPYTYLTQTYKN